MAKVEVKEETIYKKIRNSFVSNNFKEQQDLHYGCNVFSDGKIRIAVKVVPVSDLLSYSGIEESIFDFMFEIFSLLVNENYDGIILVCPSRLGELLDHRMYLLQEEYSKKLYVISYDRSREVHIEVEAALSLFKDRIKEWRTKKELKKQEVKTGIKEKIEAVPKVYEQKKRDELSAAITELNLRVRNLEEKYNYIISRLEQVSYNVPKVVSTKQEFNKVEKEEKVEIAVKTKQSEKSSGLPSFFENNPWVEILSNRGKDKQ